VEGSAAESARLAALLPDVPRFVETRGMLLEGSCEILGLEEDAASPSFVVRDGEEDLVCVVGYPAREAITEAVAHTGNAAVIAMPENVSRVAQAVPSREPQPAILHLLRSPRRPDGDLTERLPVATEGEPVRLLSGSEELRLLPSGLRPELRTELERALRGGTPTVAAFVGGVPVSFCYVASETEGLWDVAIDTLEEHRRQGHAVRCAASLIRHMRDTAGKEPVWGAVESNAPSMGLAAKLGFVPMDRVFVFEPVRTQ
jgi:GNAT superfamily N-acetyltransferase